MMIALGFHIHYFRILVRFYKDLSLGIDTNYQAGIVYQSNNVLSNQLNPIYNPTPQNLQHGAHPFTGNNVQTNLNSNDAYQSDPPPPYAPPGCQYPSITLSASQEYLRNAARSEEVLGGANFDTHLSWRVFI